MQFPSAANGSKKIFTGELLSLIAAICVGLSAVLGILGAAGAAAVALEEGAISGAAIGGIAAAGALGLVSGILAIIATILTIVGTVQCAKDENSFKAALIALLVSLVFSILAGFFSSNTVLAGVADVVNKVASIFITVMIINGFCVLADKLNNAEIRQRGNSILKFIVILLILEIILSVITRFLPNVVGVTVAGVLGVVILILSIIQYFLFLSFLGKARNMLNS